MRFLSILLALGLSGCASLREDVRYEYDLERAKSNDQQGDLSITGLQARQLSFEYKNFGKSTAKIIWDESVLVDVSGAPRRVIHQGVKYNEASQSMPPSIVPAGGSLKDFVVYADGLQFIASNWIEEVLVPCMTVGQLCRPEEYYGKSLTLLLTVESEGKKKEYQSKLILKPLSPKK